MSAPRGQNGFGYDSLFVPDGFEKTFAELGDAEKNKISHRSKALAKLKSYFSKLPS
ncbi:MAG TPA: non-canonical purine NTP pyrophosphatase [Verrucomicrobiae bacterium]|nr:non-canonical purine NTP pyrophosphatase [Verrucomicrobiae bacterium]